MGGLSASQIDQFEQEGYLVVPAVLDHELFIAPVLAEYEVVLDELCRRLYADGQINGPLKELAFPERAVEICRQTGTVWWQEFDIALPPKVLQDTPIHTGPAVFRLLTAPPLLDVVESIVGDEILSNPVQHVRLMIPDAVSRTAAGRDAGVPPVTPWHQDQGVLTAEADETPLLTVWSPLVDVPVERGPLQVVPRSHNEGLITHCAVHGLSIPEALLPGKPIPVPMRAGDVLLLHRCTAHAALPNLTDEIRWSFDLRYQPVGYPTGREAFPSFVARSSANPGNVLTDSADYAAAWFAARDRLAEKQEADFYRWDTTDPACA